MSGAVDFLVVGGGLLGSAIAYGLVRRGRRVVVLDEDDTAFRAARGNFGLVWVQGKGAGLAPYAAWTQTSARLWPEFAAELSDLGDIALQLDQPGGIHLCLSEAEVEARATRLATLAAQPGSAFEYEMLGPNALARHLPGLGPEVAGGSYSPHDGHVDPLRLLRALQAGVRQLGGRIETGRRVHRVEADGGGFRAATEGAAWLADRVVLAAGLGNRALAPVLGMRQPVHPQKGQVLVTERAAPSLRLPTTHVRQTGDGTVMLGDSQEDAGFDVASDPGILRQIADRARRSFPALARLQVVRAWAALRVMTPDGHPVYEASTIRPGAFAAACHSGVTLAAVHAERLAAEIDAGSFGPLAQSLGPERFDVQAA